MRNKLIYMRNFRYKKSQISAFLYSDAKTCWLSVTMLDIVRLLDLPKYYSFKLNDLNSKVKCVTHSFMIFEEIELQCFSFILTRGWKPWNHLIRSRSTPESNRINSSIRFNRRISNFFVQYLFILPLKRRF